MGLAWANESYGASFFRNGARPSVLAVIPLNIDGYLLREKWKSGKARKVRSRLAADFTVWERDNDKYEKQLQLVKKALRPGGEVPPVSQLGKSEGWVKEKWILLQRCYKREFALVNH